MFRCCLFGAIVLASSISFAIRPTPGAEINYSVYSQDYPAEQLKGPVNENVKDRQLLSPQKREDAFLKSGVTKITQKWSHYEKDMLVLRAQNKKLSELSKKYPKIQKSKLAKLQQVLKESH